MIIEHSPDEKPLDVQVHTVHLTRPATGGLGMIVYDSVGLGIRICQLRKGSPAQKCGKIQLEDVIISINGIGVLHASYEDVAQAIRLAGNNIELQLASGSDIDNAAPLQQHEITIEPEPRLKIEHEIREDGVFVVSVEGGEVTRATHKCMLETGDRIVSIDDQDIELVPFDEVFKYISIRRVYIIVERDVRPKQHNARLVKDGPSSHWGLNIVSKPGGYGVRVLDIEAHSIADQTRGVQIGDWIVEVNGIDLRDMPFLKARQFFTRPQALLNLSLVHDSIIDTTDTIKRCVVTFGPTTNVKCVRSQGCVVVSEITGQHPANIEVGNSVFSINGLSTTNMTQEEIDSMLEANNLHNLTLIVQDVSDITSKNNKQQPRQQHYHYHYHPYHHHTIHQYHHH